MIRRNKPKVKKSSIKKCEAHARTSHNNLPQSQIFVCVTHSENFVFQKEENVNNHKLVVNYLHKKFPS